QPSTSTCGGPSRSQPARASCICVSLLLDPRTDSEGVAVRVAEGKLADAPGLVGRRPGHGPIVLKRQGVRCSHLVGRTYPPTNPDGAGVLIVRMLRHGTAARALPIFAQEDLDLAAAHGPKGWRIAPIPKLSPA